MKITARILSLILAGALCAGILTGCGSSESDGSSSASSDASSAASSSASGENASAPTETNLSEGLEENGFLSGIKALDYVTLPADYSAIPLDAEKIAVSDEDVQNEINNILQQFATPAQITDRAVEKDDWVNIDYSGSIDGEKFDGGTAANQRVLAGSDQFIDDFLTQIIGHKPGETFDVNATFPEEYQEPSLAGKDSVFSVKINYIEGEPVMPEFNDEFVKANLAEQSGFETADAVREDIRTQLQAVRTTQFVWEYMKNNTQFKEIPQAAIDYQSASLINSYKNTAAMYGIPFEDFLKSGMGIEDEAALIEKMQDQIDDSAKQLLIMQAIAEDADLHADDDAIKEYFKKNMGTEDYSQYVEHFGRPYVSLVVMSELSNSYLIDNAVEAK